MLAFWQYENILNALKTAFFKIIIIVIIITQVLVG